MTQENIPADIDVMEEYKKLYMTFNALVVEHNKLVDAHNNICADAKALLKFIEDLCYDLKLNIDKNILAPKIITSISPYQSKDFTQFLYGNIFSFLGHIKTGIPVREVYELWKEEHEKIYSELKKQGGH